MRDENRDVMVPVRIIEEDECREIKEGFSSSWQKYRFLFCEKMEDASRGFKPTALFLACALSWTVVTCAATGVIVRGVVKHNTEIAVTERVTSELRRGFQEYLDKKEEEERRSNFLTGDESKQAAIDDLVEPIAEHIASLRMDRGVTIDGVKTYVWGVDFARLKSGKYGSTIREVLNGNLEGYVEGHAVRNEDRELARELCTDYVNGEFPDRWRPDLEFAEINPDGSVTARNMLYTNSMTKFWGFES